MADCERYLNVIAEKLRKGCASVLVGAGFSMNAEKDPLVPHSPSWDELGKIFAEKLCPDELSQRKLPNDPIILADMFEAVYKRSDLDDILINRINDDSYVPGLAHNLLLKLPWTDVFTTNYDRLLERASRDIFERNYKIIYTKEDLVDSANQPRIIKLHGSFPSVRPFVITSEDYRRYPIDNAAFVNTVQQALIENTLCLIGFSGNDPNFLKWIGWIRDNLGAGYSPIIYMLVPSEQDSAMEKLLQQRNIVLVKVYELLDKDIEEDSRKVAIEKALKYLQKKTEIKPIRECKITMSTDVSDKEYYKTEITRLAKFYNNWVIIPNPTERFLIHSLISKSIKIIDEIFCQDKISFNDLEYIIDVIKLSERSLFIIDSNVLTLSYQMLHSLKDKMVATDNFDDRQKVLVKTIAIHLRRNYRQRCCLEGIELCDEINDMVNVKLPYEEECFFIYEKCLWYFQRFDYQHVINLIKDWNVSDVDSLWQLRLVGLKVALGMLDEAYEITTRNLRRLINMNSQCGFDGSMLLLESCFMEIHNQLRVECKSLWNKDDGYEWRKELYRKYGVDCKEINSFFVRKLHPLQPEPVNYYEQRNFRLSINYTFQFGKETEYYGTAYSYLQLRELTGNYYRYGIVFNDDITVKEALRRMFEISPYWVIAIVVNLTDKKLLDTLLGRAFIGSISSYTDVDNICRMYLDSVGKNIYCLANQLDEHRLRSLTFAASRFFCRCSDNILHQGFEILKLLFGKKGFDYNLNEYYNLWIGAYSKNTIPEYAEKYLFDNGFIGEDIVEQYDKETAIAKLKDNSINFNRSDKSDFFEIIEAISDKNNLSVDELDYLIEVLEKLLGNINNHFFRFVDDDTMIVQKLLLQLTNKRVDWGENEQHKRKARELIELFWSNNLPYLGLLEAWNKLFNWDIRDFDYNVQLKAVLHNPKRSVRSYNLGLVADELKNQQILTDEQLKVAFHDVLVSAFYVSMSTREYSFNVLISALENKPDWYKTEWQSVLDLLTLVRCTTTTNYNGWNEQAEDCIACRKIAMVFAKRLIELSSQYELDEKLKIELEEWKQIGINQDEFAEVRNAWLD